jgi:hypothetical protein
VKCCGGLVICETNRVLSPRRGLWLSFSQREKAGMREKGGKVFDASEHHDDWRGLSPSPFPSPAWRGEALAAALTTRSIPLVGWQAENVLAGGGGIGNLAAFSPVL